VRATIVNVSAASISAAEDNGGSACCIDLIKDVYEQNETIAQPVQGFPIVSFVVRVASTHRQALNLTYVSFEIKSKIGMYIAMTMPPTTTPRIAIMIGSSNVSRPATAVSTSSS
jgi:hypothetical protein